MTTDLKKLAEVRRYTYWCRFSHGHNPAEDKNGEFVRYSDYTTLAQEVETLRDERNREFDRIEKKLEEGTLHVGYCNGHRDVRVGADGYICNCTLGSEIKSLRYQLKQAQEALARHEEAAPQDGETWKPETKSPYEL